MNKLPQISGADRIEGNCVSLLQSQKNVIAFLFAEDTNYKTKLVCKRNTQNILFLHNTMEISQDISLEIHMEKEAQLFCIALLHTPVKGTMNVKIQNTCEDGARFHFIALHTNQGKSNIHVTSHANGSHISSDLFCVGIGKGSSSQDTAFINISSSSNNTGKIVHRAVLFDEAQCKQEGLPQIEKGGKNNSYSLEQRTLLLGKKARIVARPQLFVANNTVQASHSAAISTFPAEDLFYLESRGLDKKQATELAVEGFVQELFQDIPSMNMRACLSENMKKFIES